MFKAYFDEGSDDVRIFIMGGWLAPFDEWEQFSDAWARELKCEPSIEYFNHNDAMGLKCQFAGWTPEDRDKKVETLARIIAKYDLTGFVGGIGLHKLKQLFGHSVLPKKTLRNFVTFTEPYHFGCLCVISQILGYQVNAIKNLIDQVDFIFDDGVRFFHDCAAIYPKFKDMIPPEWKAIAGTMVPLDDKNVVALQAADMLVGQALLNLRTAESSAALEILVAKRIFQFNCLAAPPESIPKAISKMNVMWATRQLDKAKRKKT